MAESPLRLILRRLRRLAVDPATEPADGELLRRYARSRDEAAFETILRRHGPMVWGVCTRQLRDRHAAEDAFQATFLVLAKQAQSVRRPESLGCWLHGVARRVAHRLRARRLVYAPSLERVATTNSLDEVSGRELAALLDDELGRLPERLRAPLVLCYLEGHTRDEAAARLGWSLGTLKRRLERGRAVLRTRLDRRGVALSAAMLTTALTEGAASGAVPVGFTAMTVQAAAAFVAGQGGQTGPAILAEEIMRISLGSKLWVVAVSVLVAGSLGLAGGWVALTTGPGEAPPPLAGVPQAAPPAPRLDRFGDPLPDRALARLGTLRFRHQSGPVSLAVSPDGKLLAGGGILAVTVWDALTGRVVHHFAVDPIRTDNGSRYSFPLESVAFSADGTRLAAGARLYSAPVNAPIYVWDLITSQLSLTLPGHPSGVRDLAFADGDFTLVSVGGGPTFQGAKQVDHPVTVTQWSLGTGRAHRTFEEPAGHAATLAVSRDGNMVAVGSFVPEDKKGARAAVWVWDAGTGDLRYRREATGNRVGALAFSADGRSLARIDDADVIVVSDATSGRELRRWPSPNDVAQALAFSPDGATLATASRDAKLRIWDAATGNLVRDVATGDAHLSHLAFVDARTAVVLPFARSARFWDVTTGQAVRDFEGHISAVGVVAWSPDGRTAVTIAKESIRAWDSATGQERWRVGRQATESAPDRLGTCAAFAPDGRALAVGGDGGRLELLDPATGRSLRRLEGHTRAVTWAGFTPAGDRLISISASEQTARVWDVVTGREVSAVRDLPKGSELAAASPDGRVVAVAVPYEVHLYDAATGQLIRQWRAQESSLSALAFSADGRLLATGGYDQEVAVWEVATGKQRMRAKQRCSVYGLAFAPDGRTLASGGDNLNDSGNRVRLWDTTTGQEIAALSGHRSNIHATAFSPDGRKLLSGSSDTTVLVWDVAEFTQRP